MIRNIEGFKFCILLKPSWFEVAKASFLDIGTNCKNLIVIDFERVPRVTYLELVELIGEKEAVKHIKRLGYNYKSIVNFILIIRVKRTFAKVKREVLDISITLLVIKILILYGVVYLAYFILKDTGYF